MALAKERTVNAAANVHSVHGEFSAPPYGQPHVAPDNPPGASQPMQQPADPEQMTPEMAMAHHMTDLAKKQADIANTRASTLLTAAKIPATAQTMLHTAAQTIHTVHQAHNLATTTNRLMKTPITAPQPPGGAP
jgi:hypothetical protein